MKDIPLRRSMAFLIDMGIVSISIAIFENLFPITIQTHEFDVSGIRFAFGISLAPVFYILYFIIFDIIADGRTPGKSILGILVVSEFGKRLSTKKHLLRSFYKTVSVFVLPISIFLFIFQKYTLQDYYTDTH
ncbi:MAG: RDD family protein, partial [Bacteroidota bacterium]